MASAFETSTLDESLLRHRVRSRVWLLADPRDVVEVGVARREGGAGPSAGVEPGLRRLAARIGRARLPVLLRRHATVALALAIPLEALALAGVLPQLVVALAPLALFAATLAWALRKRLTPIATAQFLDERLLLFDRLGTGLELERRGTGVDGELERRALAEATALVEKGTREWRPRAAAAPREWGAAGVALAVLVALVVLAVVPGSGSGASGARATARGGEGGAAGKHHALNKKGLEQYLGAHSGPAQIKPGQAAPGEIRPAEPQNGKADAGKNSQRGGTYVTPSEGVPTGAQQGFHFSDESLDEGRAGVHASGKSQVGGAAEGKAGGPSEGKAGGGKSAGGGKGPAEAADNKQSTNGHDASQAAGGSPTGANPGTQTPVRAPASKASTAKGGSSQESPETGSPGGNTAGNGAGGNKTGQSREVEGTQSKGLKLQAGYAPYKSAQGGLSKGGTGNRQGGGGKARTGQTEGATKGNGTFSFVPATGGSANPAGGGQGLAQSYSAALGFLERLPW